MRITVSALFVYADMARADDMEQATLETCYRGDEVVEFHAGTADTGNFFHEHFLGISISGYEEPWGTTLF